MASVMCLQLSMLEEDNIEHANWHYHLFTLMMNLLTIV